MNSASLPNNNPDLTSWYTFYSRVLLPNRYHLPYLHVLGCWEWQIDWENSHITTQWETECVVCCKQRNTAAMALTPSKCLLLTESNHNQSVCVRVMEDNSGDNVKDFWWFVDSEARHGRGENAAPSGSLLDDVARHSVWPLDEVYSATFPWPTQVTRNRTTLR